MRHCLSVAVCARQPHELARMPAALHSLAPLPTPGGLPLEQRSRRPTSRRRPFCGVAPDSPPHAAPPRPMFREAKSVPLERAYPPRRLRPYPLNNKARLMDGLGAPAALPMEVNSRSDSLRRTPGLSPGALQNMLSPCSKAC